jgi:hypothetical protein
MDDIIYYNVSNPFKALKRAFALIKYNKNTEMGALLVPILNSDLGRLYQVITDLKTLEDLLSRPSSPVREIKLQIEEMKVRLGNIYQLRDFLQREHDILGSITRLLRMNLKQLKDSIGDLIDVLQKILNRGTMKFGKNIEKAIEFYK